MITIIKDGETIRCSENTYKTMFKRLGYEIAKPKETKVEITKVDTRKEETIEEIPVIEIKKEKNVSKSKVGKNK